MAWPSRDLYFLCHDFRGGIENYDLDKGMMDPDILEVEGQFEQRLEHLMQDDLAPSKGHGPECLDPPELLTPRKVTKI